MLADWMTSLKTSKAFLREMQKPFDAGMRGNSGKVMSIKEYKNLNLELQLALLDVDGWQ